MDMSNKVESIWIKYRNEKFLTFFEGTKVEYKLHGGEASHLFIVSDTQQWWPSNYSPLKVSHWRIVN